MRNSASDRAHSCSLECFHHSDSRHSKLIWNQLGVGCVADIFFEASGSVFSGTVDKFKRTMTTILGGFQVRALHLHSHFHIAMLIKAMNIWSIDFFYMCEIELSTGGRLPWKRYSLSKLGSGGAANTSSTMSLCLLWL